MRSELIHKIFNSQSAGDWSLVREIFAWQFHNNPVYQQFCLAIGRTPEKVGSLEQLPFLPIRFFKTHQIRTGQFEPETWFESSGTTGTQNSRHDIRSLDLYRKSFLDCFRQFYGNPEDWCILGLLPSYLEREHSSLVVMVDELIRLSGHRDSGFYLYDHERLKETLEKQAALHQKVLLFGVTFALLDFAENYSVNLPQTTIIETGGMKGRRQELTRQALHQQLAEKFSGTRIHSEYGMTELLSQAYCGDDGLFFTPGWMKILLREEDDPFRIIPPPPTQLTQSGNRSSTTAGVVNIIDLANLDSCSFLATDDLGKMHSNGGFEILGRLDNSDIRGCSLLTA